MIQSEDFQIYLKKAAEDIVVLTKLLKDREVSDSSWGFHAQQALEKMLKAHLTKIKIPFSKSHDLGYLYDLIPTDKNKIFLDLTEELDELTPFAVTSRYDDVATTSLNREPLLKKISNLYKQISTL